MEVSAGHQSEECSDPNQIQITRLFTHHTRFFLAVDLLFGPTFDAEILTAP